MYYQVLSHRQTKAPRDYHLFGYIQESAYLQMVKETLRKWEGQTGELTETREAEEAHIADRMHLRFPDGGEAWFYPWMLREVQQPTRKRTLPDIYCDDSDDPLAEFFPMTKL